MRFAAMASAALRYGICPLGRVLLVAIQTPDFCFVFPSAGVYGLRLLGMAQDTLRIGQRRDLGGSRLDSAGCLRARGRGPNACPLFTSKNANDGDHANDTNDDT
jgi:hypothetical protein